MDILSSPALSMSVMKSGVLFIMLNISSFECDLIDAIEGGSLGAFGSFSTSFSFSSLIGNGASLEGAKASKLGCGRSWATCGGASLRLRDSSKSSGSSSMRDIVIVSDREESRRSQVLVNFLRGRKIWNKQCKHEGIARRASSLRIETIYFLRLIIYFDQERHEIVIF